jgi:hypothetical protein
MHRQIFLYGMGIWAVATFVLRLAGQHLLHAGDWKGPILLFAVSFPLMALLTRRICQRFQLPREQWLEGAVSLALPTLLLDPFSSALFPLVFPNRDPHVAGVFGGWMLWCCAGAMVGALPGRSELW